MRHDAEEKMHKLQEKMHRLQTHGDCAAVVAAMQGQAGEGGPLTEDARRHLELWQQHISQAAKDTTLTAGAEQLSNMIGRLQGFGPDQSGNTDDDDPRRTQAASSTSDGSGGDLSELVRRMDTLEKRLDALEQIPGVLGQGEGEG